jgi:hypothetical protein
MIEGSTYLQYVCQHWSFDNAASNIELHFFCEGLRNLESCCATLWWRWLVFSVFLCNGAPVEWNWQGKTDVLGEKPFPVPLRPPQIPHELTRASAVRGRRLTAWAMARPQKDREFYVYGQVSSASTGGGMFETKCVLPLNGQHLCFILNRFWVLVSGRQSTSLTPVPLFLQWAF